MSQLARYAYLFATTRSSLRALRCRRKIAQGTIQGLESYISYVIYHVLLVHRILQKTMSGLSGPCHPLPFDRRPRRVISRPCAGMLPRLVVINSYLAWRNLVNKE